MACATLKRSLDWESLNQRPTKRRRCGIYPPPSGSAQSTSTQPGSGKPASEPVTSVFADASLTKLTPGSFIHFPRIQSTFRHFSSLIFDLSLSLSLSSPLPSCVCVSNLFSGYRKNGSKHTRWDHAFESSKAVKLSIQLRENARLRIKRLRNGTGQSETSRHAAKSL